MEMAPAYDNTNRTRSSGVIRLLKRLYDLPNSLFTNLLKTHDPSLVAIVAKPTYITRMEPPSLPSNIQTSTLVGDDLGVFAMIKHKLVSQSKMIEMREVWRILGTGLTRDLGPGAWLISLEDYTKAVFDICRHGGLLPLKHGRRPSRALSRAGGGKPYKQSQTSTNSKRWLIRQCTTRR